MIIQSHLDFIITVKMDSWHAVQGHAKLTLDQVVGSLQYK